MTIKGARVIAALTALLMVGVATPASAEPPGGGGGGDGNGNYHAYVNSLVRIKGSGYKGRPSVQVDYDPPHCWYQPRYTYDEMVEWVRQIWFVWHHQGPEDQIPASDWRREMMAKIREHEGEAGKIFWFLADDGTDAGWACYASTDPFWIYVGPQPPAVPNDLIIDPMDLALIARANLTLPKPQMRLNPPARGGVNKSYVGLETFVGVGEAVPLDVTAYVEGFPALSAQIVATPVRVEITSTGPDKVSDGKQCPNYEKGMRPEDGCWISFERASIGGPYTITVTQIWDIASNVPGANLQPDPARMSVSETIVVDEIQSTVTR
jgi:hypothetical protein